MPYSIAFNEEKNQLLKATRGVCFEDVIDAIAVGNLIANILHPSPRHSHQRIMAVKIQSYIYAVPYVVDQRKKEIFLKTVYPSRVLTKKYMRGGRK